MSNSSCTPPHLHMQLLSRTKIPSPPSCCSSLQLPHHLPSSFPHHSIIFSPLSPLLLSSALPPPSITHPPLPPSPTFVTPFPHLVLCPTPPPLSPPCLLLTLFYLPRHLPSPSWGLDDGEEGRAGEGKKKTNQGVTEEGAVGMDENHRGGGKCRSQRMSSLIMLSLYNMQGSEPE